MGPPPPGERYGSQHPYSQTYWSDRVNSGAVTSCPHCGEGLDGVPEEDPCPKCGRRRDTGSNAHRIGAAALTVSATLTAHAGIIYNQRRPWQEKWRDVLHDLQEIDDAYNTDARPDTDDLRRSVLGFFKSCRELADWLTRDTGNGQAMPFMYRDSDLRLCNGIAQTAKHYLRKPSPGDPDPITAQISSITSVPEGERVEIGWRSHTGNAGSVDALDLARRCAAAWENFFNQHGLDPTG